MLPECSMCPQHTIYPKLLWRLRSVMRLKHSTRHACALHPKRAMRPELAMHPHPVLLPKCVTNRQNCLPVIIHLRLQYFIICSIWIHHPHRCRSMHIKAMFPPFGSIAVHFLIYTVSFQSYLSLALRSGFQGWNKKSTIHFFSCNYKKKEKKIIYLLPGKRVFFRLIGVAVVGTSGVGLLGVAPETGVGGGWWGWCSDYKDGTLGSTAGQSWYQRTGRLGWQHLARHNLQNNYKMVRI